MKNVYIIGSKGIPAKYGGFETFVEKLTENQVSRDIQYHVACMEENSYKSDIYEESFLHNGAKCFNIKVPNIGPAKAIIYDVLALKKSIEIAKKNHDEAPIFYVLACRIGPFIGKLKKEIRKINGQLFVNPDGHEWKRQKWSYPVRRYWKLSERLMVKHADLMICDSKNIEKYIEEDYKQYNPQTTYIAYGTDITPSSLNKDDLKVRDWFLSKGVSENNYYLAVGRFVPENNYQTMIREFMKSNTNKTFVLVTNVEDNKFFNKLKKETHFEKDKRIKFVGTVYDQELLKYIRENAFAYIHGHEVGGTNPSLLEALTFTKVNLLLEVGFNIEVGKNGVLYWKKNNLHSTVDEIEISYPKEKLLEMTNISQLNIKKNFSWKFIVSKYEGLFGGD